MITLDELIAALQALRADGATGREPVRLDVEHDPDVLIHYLTTVSLAPNGHVDLEAE